MPRTFLAAERTLLAGDHSVAAKLEVKDSLGAWHDLSAYLVEARWGENIDAPVMTGTVTLLRSLGTLATSIAPAMTTAPLNNIGGGFAPLVDGGRAIRLSTCVIAIGGAPGVWREVFTGRIGNPDWGGDANTLVIAISDLGAWLMSSYIQTAKDYGSAAGVAIETVMQQILTDNPTTALGAITLYTPVSPAVNLHAYTQAKGPILDALRTLAAQIGWDVRFMYDAANVFRLTFFQPPRAKTVPDLTFGGGEYYAISQLVKNSDDVRTVGLVSFIDHATNAVLSATAHAPAPQIAQYGEVYIEIAEAASSNIDTLTEAQAMIDAIIADLGDALATQSVELDYNPLVQLFDLNLFLANGEHYDVDQKLATVTISHVLSAQGDTTTLLCRGTVAGAYQNWLLLQGTARQSNGPSATEIFLSNFRITARDALSVTYSWDDTPNAVEVWGFDKTVALPVVTEPWPDLTTAIAPDFRLGPGAGTLTLQFPIEGFERFVQLDPRSATLVAGDQHRIVLSPAGSPPTFGKITQHIGASGLFGSITVDLDDPQGLGGTLEAWVNHNSAASADPTGVPDGTLTIGATPHTFDAFETWSTGTTLLAGIAVHPGRGKRIFFRFTNTKGVSSGIQSFQMLSEGGIIDAFGNLVPGAIADAAAFAAAVQPVQVFASVLPGSSPDGTFAYLISTGKLYKRVSGAWTASVDGADIIASSITGGKLVAGTITGTAIAAATITAAHLSISVLASVSNDLGIIVAGKLTSVSGAVTINLNATGTQRLIDAANFYILADGTARFDGVVGASTFAASFAYFHGGIGVNTFGIGGGVDFYYGSGGGASVAASVVGYYAAAHGYGISLGGTALYAGDVSVSGEADVASLKIAANVVSFGAADSGGVGFRQVLVPN